MDLDSAVRSVAIVDAPDPTVPVITYEFTFLGKATLSVDVWPTLGDTVTLKRSEWVFSFPRFKRTKTVFNTVNLFDVDITETERVYLTPEEKQRRAAQRIADRKEAKRLAKQSKKSEEDA